MADVDVTTTFIGASRVASGSRRAGDPGPIPGAFCSWQGDADFDGIDHPQLEREDFDLPVRN